MDYASLQKELLGYKPLGSKQLENVSAEKQKLILPLQLEPNISNNQSEVLFCFMANVKAKPVTRTLRETLSGLIEYSILNLTVINVICSLQ